MSRNLLIGKIVIVISLLCLIFAIMASIVTEMDRDDYDERVENEPFFENSDSGETARTNIYVDSIFAGFCYLNAITFGLIGYYLYKFNRKELKSETEFQCGSCGCDINDSWKFCSNCGLEFNNE